jgi:transposase
MPLFAKETFTFVFAMNLATCMQMNSSWIFLLVVALLPYRASRLALVCVFQYLENLSDRQAADAVRGRIDWKYALGLELTDPGFDASILCEFRARLLTHQAEQRLFEHLVERLDQLGWMKKRGIQRTDSTHVLAAVRRLNRLELLAETLRAALNAIAEEEPEWLTSWVPPVWFERYSQRIEEWKFAFSEKVARAMDQSDWARWGSVVGGSLG